MPLCFEGDSEAMPPLLARLVFFDILKIISVAAGGNFGASGTSFSCPEYTYLAFGQLSGVAWATLGSQGGPGQDLERFWGTFGLHFGGQFPSFSSSS